MCRDLYPFVGEVIINSKAFKDVEVLIPLGSSYGNGRGERSRVDRSRIEKAIVTELEAEATINHLAFDPRDLVIDIVKLSLGMGVEYLLMLKLQNLSPLSALKFFTESNPDQAMPLPPSEISNTLPEKYEDWMVRFYCRGSAKEFATLTQLFGFWRDKHLQTEVGLQ